MIDHLVAHDGMAIITDCKITDVALTDVSLARQIVNLGYDLSAAFYIRGLVALRPELAGRIRFRWHFVEATAPFGSRIVEADPMMLTIGDRKAGLTIATWSRCLKSGEWPAWSTDIGRVEMPPWVEAQQMAIEAEHPDANAAVFANSAPADYTPRKLMEPV